MAAAYTRLASHASGSPHPSAGWYEGDAALRSVSVDPEDTIPLELRRLDNARMAQALAAPVLPLIGRVAYWVALALGSVGP